MAEIAWRDLSDGGAGGAGGEWYYLILVHPLLGVRLTRWPGGAQDATWHACRNTVVIAAEGPVPLSEGALDLAVKSARFLAQCYEDGRDLEGYLAWQQPQRHASAAMQGYADRHLQRQRRPHLAPPRGRDTAPGGSGEEA